jgi:hypothetical protein
MSIHDAGNLVVALASMGAVFIMGLWVGAAERRERAALAEVARLRAERDRGR